MNELTLLEMIRRFPTLSRDLDRLATEHGMAPLHDPLPFLRSPLGSAGTRSAKAFLLHLWDSDNPFNLRQAWATWDAEHRAAFIACMGDA